MFLKIIWKFREGIHVSGKIKTNSGQQSRRGTTWYPLTEAANTKKGGANKGYKDVNCIRSATNFVSLRK